MQYIRNHYERPAFRGVIVRYCERWNETRWRIASAKNGKLVCYPAHVCGRRGERRLFHPTWNIQYPLSAWRRVGVLWPLDSYYDD
jgi:hypothetical protein